MNKLAIVLVIIGILQIIGGLIIGINSYNELMWIWGGIVTGVILFAFASIIYLLQQNRDVAKEQLAIWKGKYINQDEDTSIDDISEEESLEKNDGFDDLRKELREQGYEREYIETIVDIRKRLGNK